MPNKLDEFRYGGIVNENFQVPEAVHGGPDQPPAIRINGNVGLNRDRLDSLGAAQLHRLLSLGTAAAVINDHGASPFRQAESGRTAYSHRTARNHRRFSLQFHNHSFQKARVNDRYTAGTLFFR